VIRDSAGQPPLKSVWTEVVATYKIREQQQRGQKVPRRVTSHESRVTVLTVAILLAGCTRTALPPARTLPS